MAPCLDPRRRVPLVVPCLGAAFALASTACGPDAPRPNVLLLTLDTTRADFLSPFGDAGGTTPGFDALAERGIVFELAVSTASVTPVSHASILTGLYNHRHGVRVMSGAGGYRLGRDVPTLATVLQEAGYHTAAVHSAFPVSSHFGFDRGFEHFDSIEAVDIARGQAPDADDLPEVMARFQRRSDETTDRALARLDELPEPFLLWIHYWDPHDFLTVPPKEHRSPAPPKMRRKHYAAEVRYMDSQIARLLEGFEARGLTGRTITAVVADHGEGLGDHGWGGHRLLFQEQIRVPLLLALPESAGVAPGQRVGELARTVDLLPTLLDFAGVRPPSDALDGLSLRPLLEGKPEPGRVAIADQNNAFDLVGALTDQRPLDGLLYGAMDRRWKLVYRPLHPEALELFDLETDPGETRSVAAEHPEEVERLLTELAHADPWMLEPPAELAAEEQDPAALEALASLGYAASETPELEASGWRWVCPVRAHREPAPERGACATCGRPRIPEAP